MNFKPLGALAATAMLAACGGSGADPLTFAELIDAASQIETDNLDQLAGANYTDPVTLPTSDTAVYKGIIGFADSGLILVDDMAILGEFEATANFNAQTFDGTGSNFYETLFGTEMGGTVDVVMDIDRFADLSIEYTMFGTVDGTLTLEDATIGVDGVMLGDFYGDNHDFAAGVISGTLDFSTEVSPFAMSGVFLAEEE